MMGNWGYGGSMMGYGGLGIFVSLFWIVLLIDLVLLGLWLWKQLQK